MSATTTRKRPTAAVKTQPKPPSLDRLAKVANTELSRAHEAGKSMLEHAVKCGQALREAKDQLEHGQWIPWVAEHFEGSLSTAEHYMRLAKANSEHALNMDVSEQSIRAALNDLRAVREPEDKKAKRAKIADERQAQTTADRILELCRTLAPSDLPDPEGFAAALQAEVDRFAFAGIEQEPGVEPVADLPAALEGKARGVAVKAKTPA